MLGLKIPEIGVALTPYNNGISRTWASLECSYALIRPVLL